jgi:UrcA family protein
MNTRIQNTLRAASFFLCGALTLGALQATARATDDGLPSQKVSYADLDISKPAGAKVLYNRIVAAAHRVCGSSGFAGLERAAPQQHDSFCQQLSDIGGRPGFNGRPPMLNQAALQRYFCSA